jgi:hypothetical protein
MSAAGMSTPGALDDPPQSLALLAEVAPGSREPLILLFHE